MEDNGNGRLLAVLDERTKRMDDFICEYIRRNDQAVKGHERRLRSVEQEQARVDERMGTANRWQAIYTTFAAIVAGLVGSNR